MDSILEHIPSSLQIYLDQFETEPDEAIQKLKKHVKKRNAGAAGYFLLAYLSHKNGKRDAAVDYALSAKINAPGSPFLENLHYFLAHPKQFEAWKPETGGLGYKKDFHAEDRSHPIGDLDSLINKLSAVESKRIQMSLDGEKEEEDLSETSAQVDDIVSETLAMIHEKQGHYQAAIETYKQLRTAHPHKRAEFDEQIFRLQQLLIEKEDDDKSES